MSKPTFSPNFIWSVHATGQMTGEAQRLLRQLIDVQFNRTGLETSAVVTGTKGTVGQLGIWDANGDLIGATAAAAATAAGLGTSDSPQFASVNIGAATDTTVTRVSAGVIAVEGSNVMLASNGATQANQENTSSSTTFVSPSVQHFHPSAAKCWGKANGAGTSLLVSYNITSITDNGTGDITFTIGNDFSTADYSVVVTASSTTSRYIRTQGTPGAGSVQIVCADTTVTAADPTAYNMAALGDL